MKFLKKALIVVMLVLSVAVTGFAENRSEMDVSERNALDVFFSNFAEAFTVPFNYNAVTNRELINFGMKHVKINRWKTIKNYDKTYWAVAKQEVDQAAYKYFGKHIVAESTSRYPLVGDEFLMIKATGEGRRFMQVGSFKDNGDGSYTAILNEFVGDSEDIHADVQEAHVSYVATWRAVVVKAQDDPERYNLKEYLKL